MIDRYSDSFKGLMAYYRCAILEVETKFRVFKESATFERDPIESIKTRLKSYESIVEKLERRGLPQTVESIERNLDDVAGVRIITSFPSDIYKVRDALLKQDDIILIEEKDYVANPKENGYRSLHLIIAVPIFLHDHKKITTVEIQFRTISMDWWASLEHIIKYKKNVKDVEETKRRLLECATASFKLDSDMEDIYNSSMICQDDDEKEGQ